jgi:dienelactone hydrolase
LLTAAKVLIQPQSRRLTRRDRHAPPEMIRELGFLPSRLRGQVSARIHPRAEHGYAPPNRYIYDKRAANHDWELIFAMFRRLLPSPLRQ